MIENSLKNTAWDEVNCTKLIGKLSIGLVSQQQKQWRNTTNRFPVHPRPQISAHNISIWGPFTTRLDMNHIIRAALSRAGGRKEVGKSSPRRRLVGYATSRAVCEKRGQWASPLAQDKSDKAPTRHVQDTDYRQRCYNSSSSGHFTNKKNYYTINTAPSTWQKTEKDKWINENTERLNRQHASTEPYILDKQSGLIRTHWYNVP